jgi:hypothetical protein
VRAIVDIPQAKVHRLKVEQAWKNYIDFKRAQGQSFSDRAHTPRRNATPWALLKQARFTIRQHRRRAPLDRYAPWW